MSELYVYNSAPQTPYAERHEKDFYPTPLPLIQAALRTLNITSPKNILDPGAGTGAWGSSARHFWPDSNIVGVEADKSLVCPVGYNFWINDDYINAFNFPYSFDLIIGNPPYGRNSDGSKDNKLAERFVRKSLSMLAPYGTCVFLLRLAFLEGQERGDGLWNEFPPSHVHVLSRRPSFITEGDKKGKTDATAYGVYRWDNTRVSGPTTLSWLKWS